MDELHKRVQALELLLGITDLKKLPIHGGDAASAQVDGNDDPCATLSREESSSEFPGVQITATAGVQVQRTDRCLRVAAEMAQRRVPSHLRWVPADYYEKELEYRMASPRLCPAGHDAWGGLLTVPGCCSSAGLPGRPEHPPPLQDHCHAKHQDGRYRLLQPQEQPLLPLCLPGAVHSALRVQCTAAFSPHVESSGFKYSVHLTRSGDSPPSNDPAARSRAVHRPLQQREAVQGDSPTEWRRGAPVQVQHAVGARGYGVRADRVRLPLASLLPVPRPKSKGPPRST